MGGQTIRVMIVDDHAMVRAGIRILLEQFDGIRVIGEAATGSKAIDLLEQLRPDVILMDLNMPGMDGIEAIHRIISSRPEQHIIVLSGFLDNERLIQAVQAGAQGRVDKTIPPEDLVHSIRDVSAGRPSLSPGIAWRVLHGLARSENPSRSKNQLSGVGSARRGIAVDAGEYRFVGPDNGVLSAVLQEAPPRKIVELTERKYARPTISRTFEGRDRFAPAAAWLAKGVALASLGRSLADYTRLDLPEACSTDEGVTGIVMRVDRFGNAITNIDRLRFDKAAAGPVRITAGSHEIPRLVAAYAEADDGAPRALFGSSEHLEIAIAGASAAERLGLVRGTSVVVRALT